MTEIKFDTKLRRRAAEALEGFTQQMFDKQDGEWTAVVTFGHAGRTETVKTEDDTDFVETQVKLRVLDVEVMTGPHKQSAEEAMAAARRQRMTAGTLIDEAFDN